MESSCNFVISLLQFSRPFSREGQASLTTTDEHGYFSEYLSGVPLDNPGTKPCQLDEGRREDRLVLSLALLRTFRERSEQYKKIGQLEEKRRSEHQGTFCYNDGQIIALLSFEPVDPMHNLLLDMMKW